MNPSAALAQKYIPEPMSGCWLWEAATNKDGYGMVRNPELRKMQLAHRRMWELERSDIPAGLHVLHRCDNPPCVNPDHLFLGDDADNSADKKRKGRCSSTAGEKSGTARLKTEDVLLILQMRRDGVSALDLGKKFNVSRYHIYMICLGKKWKHLTGDSK